MLPCTARAACVFQNMSAHTVLPSAVTHPSGRCVNVSFQKRLEFTCCYFVTFYRSPSCLF